MIRIKWNPTWNLTYARTVYVMYLQDSLWFNINKVCFTNMFAWLSIQVFSLERNSKIVLYINTTLNVSCTIDGNKFYNYNAYNQFSIMENFPESCHNIFYLIKISSTYGHYYLNYIQHSISDFVHVKGFIFINWLFNLHSKRITDEIHVFFVFVLNHLFLLIDIKWQLT